MKKKNEETINQCSSASGETDINMGSHVSRHSGKGLSGRRTRSSDGITNKLVGCFHSDSDVHQTIANVSTVQEDVVLVRMYGNKTDLLIDRKAETRNIQMLHSHGFAPSLYAIFRNGLAYEYVPGVTLTSQTVAQPQIWSLIAKHMAGILVDCENDGQPMLRGKIQQFLDLLPETYSDSRIDER